MLYQKINNQSIKEFEEIISKINKVYVKNRNSKYSVENGQMILVGFNENNWKVIKETMEKKQDWESIPNTMKIKEILKEMKSKLENQLKYPTPSSIEKAKEIFAKQQITISSNVIIKNLELADA